MYNSGIKGRRHSRGLRNACRKAFSAAIILLLGFSSTYAQEYPNGLSADSVNPDADARFIREMRQKMDSIRAAEHRPTVALVLSGGGAKGSSHVGAIKLLEEMDIPIDMICGTSMGGLIGGLYSMGYSTEFLDSLLRNQDWSITLSDKVDPSFVPYTSKEYRSRYLLTVPFHYDEDKMEKLARKRQERLTRRRTKLSLQAGSADLNTEAGVSNFASSLPSGYVYGFNVNNLISNLSVGYQDSLAFSTLPIPFFCVASDMISCKAKNWGNGSIKSAMRSTMSIPGMFDPVRTNGMVLVDGGTRNNFPVDLARAMGADYVIGVELSDATPDFEHVKNVGSLLGRFIAMLGKDAFNKNVDDTDVFIKPVLTGFNMLSFTPESIDTMIRRGYDAAVFQKDKLQKIKNVMPDSKPRLNNKPATFINNTPVLINEVSFDSLSDQESKMMMRKIGIKVGERVSGQELSDAASKLQATNAFESVTYSLYGSEEPYKLVFNCVKGPVHRFGASFRVDTEEWASILVNLGLNTGKLKGSKLDMEAKIGLDRYINARYSLDLPRVPTFNIEGNFYVNKAQMYSGDATNHYDINFRGLNAAAYLSNIKWTSLDVKGGVRYEQFYTVSLLSDTSIIYSRETLDKYFSGKFVSAFISGRYYTFDNKYFPSKGTDLKLDARYVFANVGAKDFSPIPIASLDFKKVFNIGEKFSIIGDLHGRMVLESSSTICHSNIVGGPVAGRYISHQMPFVGFNEAYVAEDHLAMANLDFRFNAAKNLYISVMGGYIHQAPNIGEMFKSVDLDLAGAGLQVGYNTLFGPIKLIGNWSTLDHKPGFYFSAGFDF